MKVHSNCPTCECLHDTVYGNFVVQGSGKTAIMIFKNVQYVKMRNNGELIWSDNRTFSEFEPMELEECWLRTDKDSSASIDDTRNVLLALAELTRRTFCVVEKT